jgi:dihydroorotate dehydrogenase (fumarate)
VHQAEDAIKLILAGADVTMLTSVLLTHGAERIGEMRDEIKAWMEEKEYESVEQMKGSMSRANCPDPSALERGNYMKALTSYTSELSP